MGEDVIYSYKAEQCIGREMAMELPTRSFDVMMSCQTPSHIVLIFSIFTELFPVII